LQHLLQQQHWQHLQLPVPQGAAADCCQAQQQHHLLLLLLLKQWG
jgi:hypothetical protein